MKKIVMMLVLILSLSGCGNNQTQSSNESNATDNSSITETNVSNDSTGSIKNLEKEIETLKNENDDLKAEIQRLQENTSEEISVESIENITTVDQDGKIVLGEPFQLGDYTMTIHSFEVMQDYEGNPALVFTYDWTNNSEEAASPFMTFSDKAFQSGVETNDDVFMIDGVDLGIGQKEVKPGGTITGAQGYLGIDDLNVPLEFEIEELFSFEGEPLTYTIEDLNSL